jgi:WD40 repeat protein
MRFVRPMLVLALLTALLLTLPWVARAQDTPVPVREAAIAALNQTFPNIGRPQSWSHTILNNVTTTDLGCPLLGGAGLLPAPTQIYVVSLQYPSNIYVFHVSADATQIVPCSANLLNIPPQPVVTSAPVTGGGAVNYGYRSATCPADFAGYLPPRLFLGAQALVEAGGSNNIIRQNYGRSSAPTGTEMPPSSAFLVVGGPECTGDGIVWWQVFYNGVTGWTAESFGGEYFLTLPNLLASPNAPAVPPPANPSAIGAGAVPPPVFTGALPSTRTPITAALLPSVQQVAKLTAVDRLVDWHVGEGLTLAVSNPNTAETLLYGYSFPLTSAGAQSLYARVLPSNTAYLTSNINGGRLVLQNFINGDLVGFRIENIDSSLVADRAFGGVIYDAALSHDDRLLALSYANPPSGPDARAYLEIFNTQTRVGDSLGIPAAIQSLTFTGDGRLLVALTFGGQVIAWDALTLSAASPFFSLYSDPTGYLPSLLAVNRDSTLAAVDNKQNGVTLIDINTAAVLRDLGVFTPGSASKVGAIAFSPNGEFLAVGGYLQGQPNTGNNVLIYDTATGTQLATLIGPREVLGLAFTADGSFLLARDETVVYIWGAP